MTPLPPQDIRFGLQSHLAALRWLSLIYRKPKQFEEAISPFPGKVQLAVSLLIYVHFLPYAVVVSCLGRYLIFGWLGVNTSFDPETAGTTSVLLWHHNQVGISITVWAYAWGFLASSFGSAFGIAVAITFGLAGGVVSGIKPGVAQLLSWGAAYGLAYGLAYRIVLSTNEKFREIVLEAKSPVTIGLTLPMICSFIIPVKSMLTYDLEYDDFSSALSSYASVFLLSFMVSFLPGFYRPYYHVVHLFFMLGGKGFRYLRHPVAWDDLCGLPFPGLNRLLLTYYDEDPTNADREIDRLIDYPSQRHQALRARTIVVARQCARTLELSQLDECMARLPEGEKGYLAQTQRLRELVHEIATLQARFDAVGRPVLREPLARLLVREIEHFRDKIAGFQQPLRRGFRAAGSKWMKLAESQLAGAQAVLEKEPTRQVFRAGDPVDRDGEAFVPRDAITVEIERQVMMPAGCPGIVLYGRRRTGKSTVLRNLAGFLPSAVGRCGISMQDPTASTSLTALTEKLTVEVRRGAGLPRNYESETDLSTLFKTLNSANDRLARKGRKLLFSIDEYEGLDQKIGDKTFPEDLLATLRESIQSHRNITWIFAGSHEITELPNAEWASYLVSARTVEVGPFTAAETRLLLTEPLKYSSLWRENDPERPRFAPGFWGEDGIERIHREAGGWPHLVQLIAETTVDLLNDDQRTKVDIDILERAFDKAVVRGHTVMHQLMKGESTMPGEWEYLSSFALQETQLPPEDAAIARSLRHRLLIAGDNDHYRLRVPLMARWLRRRY